MKTSITVAIFAIAAVIGTIGVATTLGAVQTAHGDPQTPHGTCGIGGPSSQGAIGCAGNVGGFIISQPGPNGNCHTTGGKFNTFTCP
jgi:hypothetical protein